MTKTVVCTTSIFLEKNSKETIEPFIELTVDASVEYTLYAKEKNWMETDETI